MSWKLNACSWRDKLFVLYRLNRRAKIFLRIGPDDPQKSSDTLIVYINCSFAENTLNLVNVIQNFVKSVQYGKPLTKMTTSSEACNFSKFFTSISGYIGKKNFSSHINLTI